MRLKVVIDNFHNHLVEIANNWNPNDLAVRKVGRGKWIFTVNVDDYIFKVSPLWMKDSRKGFTIEWGPVDENGNIITTEIIGSKKNKRDVFRLVFRLVYLSL